MTILPNKPTVFFHFRHTLLKWIKNPAEHFLHRRDKRPYCIFIPL